MRLTASLSVFRSFLAGLPQDGRIRLVVIVAENVADTGDRAPRDMCFAFFQLFWKAATGFRQDLKVSFNELSCTPVYSKFAEIVTCRVGLDVCDGLEDV